MERLAPGEGAFPVAAGHREWGRPELAVPPLARLLAARPQDEAVRYNLVRALAMQAAAVPRVQRGDMHVITAPEEIERMRPLLLRALDLSVDPEQRAEITVSLTYVTWCDSYHFRRRSYGCGTVVVVIGLVGAAANISPGLLPRVVIGLGVLGFHRGREKGWHANARDPRW